jgi:uncharacterized protein involved in type VI secretion and phage assembly
MNDLYELLSGVREGGRVYGVAVGTVREIRDPLGLGRVRVSFPWVSADDEESVVIENNDRRAHSYWARVATLMAGGGRGAYFVPDVGEEVLVAFEHGELDRPVIIGGLWNKDAKPPVAMDNGGENHIRGIYTRTKHRIELNDSSDKTSILIEDSTGKNRIRIDTANSKMELTVQGDMAISASGNITISAGGDIKLEAKGSVAVQANMDCTVAAGKEAAIRGKTQASLQSEAQASVKGAMVSVKATGVAELQGGMVKIN